MKKPNLNTPFGRRNHYEKDWLVNLLVPIISIILALIVGAIFIASTGRDPFLAYKYLFQASGLLPGPLFKDHFAEMLILASMFIATGLSFAFASRAGLFSIGAEGQFQVGAITAAFFGFAKPFTQLPAIIHIPLILIMVMLFGGAWGAIAGYLKARRGIHEVITTIMLNWIAINLIEGWLVPIGGPLSADVSTGSMGTPYISPSARLPIILPGTRLNISIIIMLVVAFLVWFILYRTTFGYELRAMGHTMIYGMEAPQAQGVDTAKRIIQIMFISGAIAALGGSFVTLGTQFHYPPVADSGYGFDGIAVALIGQNEPFGIILSSILIAALRTGGTAVQIVKIPKTFPFIIEGLIVAFIALHELVRYLLVKFFFKSRESTPSKEVS